jgi:archaemetzincin
MNLQLLPIGNVAGRVLTGLAADLTGTFGLPCEIVSAGLHPEFAFHRERQQYHSSEILAGMQSRIGASTWRMLGVAAIDLYIPILTFVFGEAQVGGTCALVSLHRLRQDFYGLPADEELLQERLLKESIHEIGHTLNLTHCDDYRCAMAASHAVEWIDLKGSGLCSVCHKQIFAVSLP